MEGLEIPSIHIDEKEMTLYRERSVVVARQAHAIAEQIVDAATCQIAVDWCAEQMTFADTIKKGWLGRIRDMWHKQHKSVCAIISEFVDPHEQGVTLVKGSISMWRAAEEKKRKAEQDRLIAEAKKKHEEETLAEAERHAAMGNQTMADAVLSNAENYTVPLVVTEAVKNVGGRKRWKVRVTDKIAFIKGVAGGAVSNNALIIDERWLEKQAALMDGHLTYPGIVCYEDEIISIRRAS